MNIVDLLDDTTILHYPNLKTVLEVERIIKNHEDYPTRTQIKQALSKKIMHQTLNVILRYLEEQGKIIEDKRRFIWIYATPEEMAKIKFESFDPFPIFEKVAEKRRQQLLKLKK